MTSRRSAPKVARLDDDMVEFAETPKDVMILDENGKPLLAGDNDRRFFEASWVHKYKGNYYFSYSTGDTHFIVYATGKSPYGPFTVQGQDPRARARLDQPPLHRRVSGEVVPLLPRRAALGRRDAPAQHQESTELKYNDDGTIVTVDAYQGVILPERCSDEDARRA